MYFHAPPVLVLVNTTMLQESIVLPGILQELQLRPAVSTLTQHLQSKKKDSISLIGSDGKWGSLRILRRGLARIQVRRGLAPVQVLGGGEIIVGSVDAFSEELVGTDPAVQSKEEVAAAFSRYISESSCKSESSLLHSADNARSYNSTAGAATSSTADCERVIFNQVIVDEGHHVFSRAASGAPGQTRFQDPCRVRELIELCGGSGKHMVVFHDQSYQPPGSDPKYPGDLMEPASKYLLKHIVRMPAATRDLSSSFCRNLERPADSGDVPIFPLLDERIKGESARLVEVRI